MSAFVRALGEIITIGRAPVAELERPRESWGFAYSVWRLAKALNRSERWCIDHTVLLRQCIRSTENSSFRLHARPAEALVEHWRASGLSVNASHELHAEPYMPRWLGEQSSGELDRPTLAPVTQNTRIQAETWLREAFGVSSWKSAAQREAVWKCLTARFGSTLLVGLPTGSGKSLLFQAWTAFGEGLTVVIVPTVALGISQLKAISALPIGKTISAENYSSGADAERVIERVQSKECRLLFSSPEACVAGRLRSVLTDHAESGWLRRVVVDEAHIVDSWGADFRIEFQLLGSLISAWRTRAPNSIQTLLLSATFSVSTPSTLRRIFCRDDDPWEEHIVRQLRPEVQYFGPSGTVAETDQVDWVTEALHYLPRPLILYVTERKEVSAWRDRLATAGFSRLSSFDGETSSSDRSTVMTEWLNDEIDIVIATSAFGVGVDKPDVRAVVHACFPENIDRFYQEVGRGGRDGAPSISLLVATQRDYVIGRDLAPTLLGDARFNLRWKALLQTATISDGNDTLRVRLNAQHQGLFGQRSYSENVRWNKRLLMLMQRAGLIQFERLEFQYKNSLGDGSSEGEEWAVIRTNFPTFEEDVAARAADVRNVERENYTRATALLRDYVDRKSPPCRLCRKQYGPLTRRACGSCWHCRTHQEAPARAVDLAWPEESKPTAPPVDVVECEALERSFDKLALAIRQLNDAGLELHFLVPHGHREQLEAVIHRAANFKRLFRVDEFPFPALPLISITSNVVVFHWATIDRALGSVNRFGARCSHLLLGGRAESPPGRWPFLHESASRPFFGHDGLSNWVIALTN